MRVWTKGNCFRAVQDLIIKKKNAHIRGLANSGVMALCISDLQLGPQEDAQHKGDSVGVDYI